MDFVCICCQFKEVSLDFHFRKLAFHGVGGEPPRLRLWGLALPTSPIGVELPFRFNLGFTESMLFDLSFTTVLIFKFVIYAKSFPDFHFRMLAFHEVGNEAPRLRLWGLALPTSPIRVVHPFRFNLFFTESMMYDLSYNAVLIFRFVI